MEKWARIKYQPCLPLGDNNSKITGSEKHTELSRKAACEGTVLLKNENKTLPLKKGSRVAIFGKAQIDYIKGGGGAGDVGCAYVINIYEGLKQKKDVEIFHKLSLFYQGYVEDEYKKGKEAGMFCEPEIPNELLKEAKEFADTAVITINRYSREGIDRKNDGTDSYFVLSSHEEKMVQAVCDNFKKVIVLLNTGAMIDTSWFANNSKIQSALLIWQGGMKGGLAAADVLMGDANPSGKLVDTCAEKFEDYPSSESFHQSEDYVKYTEDVFVGYRYFETIPGKKERVIYPFGFGLSYTSFEFSDMSAYCLNDKIYVTVKVKNTGSCAGKEVVQVYFNAPVGKITKPAINLCAFTKTKELMPSQEQTLNLSFDTAAMASYDDMGIIEKSAYVLEKGEYKRFAGNSVRNITELDYKYTLEKDVVVEKLTEYCTPENLDKRLNADGTYTYIEPVKVERKVFECEYKCELKVPEKEEDAVKLIDVYNGRISLDEFLTQLTDEELASLVQGKKNAGVANTGGFGGNNEKYGIPSPMTTDGPAGVRIHEKTGVTTTAFPVATMLACTWNTELVEEIGKAGAMEAKENNLFVWLTPALNIHRSPLCGRNFEYYSEDPYVTGKMAAAMVRGIQSEKVAATPKHFACNNKETNRLESDSILSERALREIYIKGFEICVKEAKPKTIMTAYNIINSVRASENAELITGILRGEWGYDGVVMTDWGNHASKTKEIIAGNDVRMPECFDDTKEALANKTLKRNQIAVCAKRLLELILWFE